MSNYFTSAEALEQIERIRWLAHRSSVPKPPFAALSTQWDHFDVARDEHVYLILVDQGPGRTLRLWNAEMVDSYIRTAGVNVPTTDELEAWRDRMHLHMTKLRGERD